MKIKAVLKIKNDAVICAREKLGLTQIGLDKAIGIGKGTICAIENFRLIQIKTTHSCVKKISDFLNLPIEEVAPPDLCGEEFQTQFEQVINIQAKALLEYKNHSRDRLVLPSPAEEIEKNDMVEYFTRLLDDNMHKLTFREREVIKLRYGINGDNSYTLAEVGRIFKVTKDRVRQVEAKAVRKLRRYLDADTRLNETKEFI
jgi:RNA polymerase sigma factor (sigma-70 family)